MPINFDDSANESPKPKRGRSSGKAKQTQQKINSEATAIVGGIHGAIVQQLHVHDQKWTEFEMDTAREMFEREIQSPLRIQAYRLQLWKEHQESERVREQAVVDLGVASYDLDVPCLSEGFFDSVMGLLPM